MGFLQYLQREWAVIAQAPVTFSFIVAVLALAIYAIARAWYGREIANLNSTIKLKDAEIADWKRKTEGNTPDDVKARLHALEGQVKGVLPRRLSAQQASALTQAASSFKGSIQVALDLGAAEARDLARQIATAFQAAGWDVVQPGVMGPRNPPASGVGLHVLDAAHLKPEENLISNALHAANIEFDIQQVPKLPQIEGERCYLLITARVTA